MKPFQTSMLTDHYDGFGLNDQTYIRHDERDPKAGNASHHYTLGVETSQGGVQLAEINFQHGPRGVESSTVGVTDQAVLTVLLDRYRGFQSGPYACRENALVITKLEEALLWMKKRAFERARQGVLGKNEEHAARS